MKTQIAVENIGQALSLACKTVSRKTRLPILSNALLRARGDSLEIVTTDLDVTASVTLPGARVLAAGENSLAIRNGSNFSLATLPADEFPPVPKMENARAAAVALPELRRALAGVAFAQSTDESRYVLNGVLFEVTADKINLVATDGRRLATTDIPRVLADENTAALIIGAQAKVAGLEIKLGHARDGVAAARLIVKHEAEKLNAAAGMSDTRFFDGFAFAGERMVLTNGDVLEMVGRFSNKADARQACKRHGIRGAFGPVSNAGSRRGYIVHFEAGRIDAAKAVNEAQETADAAQAEVIKARRDLECLERGPQFIVPAKAVADLLAALPKPGKKYTTSGEVVIQWTGGMVCFTFNAGVQTVQLFSKLIEGNYPNYRQVIPGECKERIQFNRVELLNAVKTAEIQTTEKSNSIKLSFRRHECLVTANAPEAGEARVSVGLNYTGREFASAFNPGYLRQALAALDTESVWAEFIDEMSPLVLKIEGPWQCVIMPMRLS